MSANACGFSAVEEYREHVMGTVTMSRISASPAAGSIAAAIFFGTFQARVFHGQYR